MLPAPLSGIALPTPGCPASSLAGAALDPVCAAASGVAGAAGSAASSVAGFGINSVLDAMGSWVSSGATWLLTQIGAVIGGSTTIDLGASWFTTHYQTMAALAGVVIVPMMLLGIIQSVYRQNATMLIRSMLVNVPLAILLTAVAVKLVQLGLAVTDALSSDVAQGAGIEAGQFMGSVTDGLSAAGAAGQSGPPSFILLLGSLAVVFGAVLVWVELLIRSAAVYVAALFLPLALASLAYPAIAHWCRRLVDTLVALVLGKFVIVSVLSLSVGALSSATGSGGGGSGTGAGGFSAVLGGAALLLLSALAPWALFRLLPFLEAGAVGHLEGLSQRAHQTVTAPARSLAHTAMEISSTSALASAASGALGGGLAHASGSLVRTAPGADDGASAVTSPSDPSAGSPAADTTGVGSTTLPGSDVPMWAGNPESTAAYERVMGEGGDEPGARPPDGSESGGGLIPLPRQTGVQHDEALGFDELGPRLVSLSRTPGGAPTGSSGPDAADPGHGR